MIDILIKTPAPPSQLDAARLTLATRLMADPQAMAAIESLNLEPTFHDLQLAAGELIGMLHQLMHARRRLERGEILEESHGN